ncbi:hypothetical protein SDC9_58269 [bioreactor metagenome]|uniref:Uncharacterized protein n=1 Tax=bioreactor metagenome TaxID=1076179 RepID=A0A644X7Y1_9ZZZZ
MPVPIEGSVERVGCADRRPLFARKTDIRSQLITSRTIAACSVIDQFGEISKLPGSRDLIRIACCSRAPGKSLRIILPVFYKFRISAGTLRPNGKILRVSAQQAPSVQCVDQRFGRR